MRILPSTRICVPKWTLLEEGEYVGLLSNPEHGIGHMRIRQHSYVEHDFTIDYGELTIDNCGDAYA
jgi:hypothetical protein